MVRIAVRLLGPLQVRRADGTAVADGEWRTAKTLDLLRLLALHNGEPVPVSSVLDKLWPEVDEARGRASLRTAASQLRKVLGEDCVDRRPGGLVLLGAWVDTQAYEALLGDARASRRMGDHARTVATVEEAEALYVGDLDLPDNPGDWLFEARDHLRRLRCRALLDAADAAAALCWMRDSLELAERAASLDTCEEAARALMRALAGVGELEKALAVFDRTRRDLANRYGVDPSPQTRALHLQLLTGTAVRSRPVGLVGHASTVQELAATMVDLRRTGAHAGVVWLEGEPGSGRDSVVAEACREGGLTLHDVRGSDWLPRHEGPELGRGDLPESDVVLMPQSDSVPSHALRVIESLASQHGGVLVVPVACAPAPAAGDASVPHRVIRVHPLDDLELSDLAKEVLQGVPTNRLLRRLRAESRGLSGLASRTARDWLSEGRVVWSVEGLDLADSQTGQLLRTSVRLRRSLRLMSPFAEDVIHVLAVAGTGMTTEALVDVVAGVHPGAGQADVEAAIEQLVSAEHLVLHHDGFHLRETNVHAEVAAWMRPQLRQLIHRLVADRVGVARPVLATAGGIGDPRPLPAPAEVRFGAQPTRRDATVLSEVGRPRRRTVERFYSALLAVLLYPDVHTYAGLVTWG